MGASMTVWIALLSVLIVLALVTLAYMRSLNGRAIRHASCDELTGLYDAATGEKMIRVMLSKMKQSQMVLAMLDLDGITQLREACGGDVCDAMTRDAAHKMAMEISGRGNLCHVMNDTFLVAIPFVGSESEALDRVERLRLLCGGTLLDRARERVAVHASAGAAIYPVNGRGFSELYEKADIALFWSKRDGKDRTTLYREAEDAGREPLKGV